MTLYVDTSALLKRYVVEHDSEVADRLLGSDRVLATSHLTLVEARRNLARLLAPTDAIEAKRALDRDLDAFALIALDATDVEAPPATEASRFARAAWCWSSIQGQLSARLVLPHPGRGN